MSKKILTKDAPKIEFKLVQIFSTEFHYKPIIKPFEHKAGSINYNIIPGIGFSTDNNQIIVTLKVIASVIPTKEEFFNATSKFVFAVPNLSIFADVSADNVLTFKDKKQEKIFIASLIGVSYSTMRGIIMEKASGTILQAEFLPLVDPSIFMKD